MKNVINLQKYYFPGEVEHEIGRFVEYYNNNERYQESLGNVTPADVYFCRHREIITKREQIKRRTLKQRKHFNLTHTVGESQPHQLSNHLLSQTKSVRNFLTTFRFLCEQSSVFQAVFFGPRGGRVPRDLFRDWRALAVALHQAMQRIRLPFQVSDLLDL